MAKDLITSFGWAKDDLEKRAVEVTSWLVEAYNKALREEINKRIKALDAAIANIKDKSTLENPVHLKS